MAEKKKQHYIPRLQLRRFAYDLKKEKVWVLDKNNQQIRSASIEDVCEENNFYRLPIIKTMQDKTITDEDFKLLDDACVKDTGKHIKDLSKEELNNLELSIENYFSDYIEPNIANIIEKIIFKTYNHNKWVIDNCYFISKEDKYNFSWFLAKEYIRTKYNRDIFENIMTETTKKIIPIVAQFYGIKIDEKDFNVEYSKEQIKSIHIKSIIDNNESNIFASIFFSNIWVLLENFTDEPFCLLDNTLILKPTHSIPKFYGYGLGSYGMTLFVPLSPNHMLLLIDSQKYKGYYENKDRCIQAIYDSNQIESINQDLIEGAYKYVIFNSKSSAEKYKKICDDNPDLYEEAQKGHVL